MPSPACEVRDGAGPFTATTNGANVTPANVVTIRLASTACVGPWTLSCVYTDDLGDAAVINAGLVVDGVTKTATFTAPGAGRALIFRSQINGGNGPSGADASYTTTFGIYTLAPGGRVHAINETFESHATFGYVADINNLIRNPSTAPTPTGTGFRHIAGSVEAGAAKLVENADVHASAAIALSKLAAGGTNEQVVKQTAGALALGALNLASSVAVGSSILGRVNGGLGFDASTLTGQAGKVVRVNSAESSLEVGSAPIDPSVNGLRLTLTSGSPVTTSDVATGSTLYLTPFTSGGIALYDGTVWNLLLTGEVSLALSGLSAGSNYDVFAYNNSGTVTLELSAAWSNDTTRADAVTTQNGVTVKSGALTRRLVGTIRAISATTTTDTVLQRFVWNGPEPARQVRRFLRAIDSTNSWTYTTASFRQANAASANKVEYVSGSAFTPVTSTCEALSSASSASNDMAVSIGVDSTTVGSAQIHLSRRATDANGDIEPVSATYDGHPGLGYHYLAWLEFGATTNTYYGDNGNSALHQSGIRAAISM